MTDNESSPFEEKSAAVSGRGNSQLAPSIAPGSSGGIPCAPCKGIHERKLHAVRPAQNGAVGSSRNVSLGTNPDKMHCPSSEVARSGLGAIPSTEKGEIATAGLASLISEVTRSR